MPQRSYVLAPNTTALRPCMIKREQMFNARLRMRGVNFKRHSVT